jgi:hypothetical protein
MLGSKLNDIFNSALPEEVTQVTREKICNSEKIRTKPHSTKISEKCEETAVKSGT